MLKQAIMSAAFFMIAATSASACVSYDGPTDTFANSCGEDIFVQYRTVGGGCYVSDLGSFTFKMGETHSDPQLSDPCGSTSKWRVDWAWCNNDEWVAGTCKPKF